MTAGGREFQVAGAAQLKDRLPYVSSSEQHKDFMYVCMYREMERPITTVTDKIINV